MIKLSKIAKKYNLKIIEDASQAHGSTFLKNFQDFIVILQHLVFIQPRHLDRLEKVGQ